MQLMTRSGPVRLDTAQVIGAGGEAKVYAVKGNRQVVAKVYHQPTPQRADKLRAMVGHAPVDPGRVQGHISIAWPQDLLFDSSGSVSGYLMPAIRDSYRFLDVYHPGDRRKKLPAGFGYRYLLRTAHNICVAVAAVHAMGYVIGDLNDSNILVRADTRVTLIDCDSFQIGSHGCPVGRPEYMAPELHGVSLSSVVRGVDQDNFALAILVYRLLMSGVHPYAGVGEPGALDDRIRAGLCSHAPGGPAPPRGAPRLEWLPPPLQQLIRAAFIDGYGVPSARPAARIWADRLLAAEKELVICRRDGGHPYFRHERRCPVCTASASPSSRRSPQAKAPPSGAGQRRKPPPNMGVKRVRARGRRYTVLALLVAAVSAVYLWRSWQDDLKEQAETIQASVGQPIERFQYFRRQVDPPGRAPVDPFARARTSIGVGNPVKRIPSPARQEDQLVTGSDIYREYIGEDPY